MSSFTRTIQRTQPHKGPHYDKKAKVWRLVEKPGRAHFLERGSHLGVNYAKDSTLLARQKRDAKWGRVT
ncbi:MAG: hypothetical protein KGL39_42165 [Patescibacteria group bacterium]|nr:hypothetical protein [Patescibacteria group bacterium]